MSTHGQDDRAVKKFFFFDDRARDPAHLLDKRGRISLHCGREKPRTQVGATTPKTLLRAFSRTLSVRVCNWGVQQEREDVEQSGDAVSPSG